MTYRLFCVFMCLAVLFGNILGSKVAAQEKDPLSLAVGLKMESSDFDELSDKYRNILFTEFGGVWSAQIQDKKGQTHKAKLKVSRALVVLELKGAEETEVYGFHEVYAERNPDNFPIRKTLQLRLQRVAVEPIPPLKDEVGKAPLPVGTEELELVLPDIPLHVHRTLKLPIVWNKRPDIVRLELSAKRDDNLLNGSWALEKSGEIKTQGFAEFVRDSP